MEKPCFCSAEDELFPLWTLTFQFCLLGSQTVARSILQAASVHLTPVTLELGGKCPCFIYGRVNIAATVRRLAWSKYFNAGQSCVAPDYVLCSPALRDALVPAMREALEEFYTKEPQACPDLSRIVSPRHWTRLMNLLKSSSGKVVLGGESDEEDKYIGENVLFLLPNVTWSHFKALKGKKVKQMSICLNSPNIMRGEKTLKKTNEKLLTKLNKTWFIHLLNCE